MSTEKARRRAFNPASTKRSSVCFLFIRSACVREAACLAGFASEGAWKASSDRIQSPMQIHLSLQRTTFFRLLKSRAKLYHCFICGRLFVFNFELPLKFLRLQGLARSPKLPYKKRCLLFRISSCLNSKR